MEAGESKVQGQPWLLANLRPVWATLSQTKPMKQQYPPGYGSMDLEATIPSSWCVLLGCRKHEERTLVRFSGGGALIQGHGN